jgi:hypothetical protein
MADTTGPREPERSGDRDDQSAAGRPDDGSAGQPMPEPGWSAEQPPAWSGPPGWTAPGGAAAGGGPAGQQGGWGPPPTAAPPDQSGGWKQRDGWTQPGVAWGEQSQPGWSGQRGWGYPAWEPEVKPGIIPLRPLGVGEILDGAISAMRRHPKVMLGVGALVGVVSAVLNAAVTLVAFRDVDSLDPETATDEEVLNAAVASLGGALASFAILAVVTLIATGILTVAIGRAVLGQPVTLGEAWQSARPYLLQLIGLSILSGVAVFGVFFAGPIVGILIAVVGAEGLGISIAVIGGIAGAVAAVFLYVKFAISAPALILERQGVVAAMRRSFRLVTGTWWRTLGILILAAVLAWIIGGIIQTPFSLLGMGTSYYLPGTDVSPPSVSDVAIANIGGIIASAVTLPFSAGVTTLLYVDRRMRREGLDIELARAAGTQTTQPPRP